MNYIGIFYNLHIEKLYYNNNKNAVFELSCVFFYMHVSLHLLLY